ncbi:hypothetical protein PVIIG_05396 [Plasmodium vivax India VII]|uniref:VIR protein n=1 Tax=Plasmodium vivax India VII TaxID=1077284 RepID=A0A0J9S242_PLAVI|nr:hypothetical protein PVIIG_05396 [Plasmodium vivax India VII]
MAYPCQKDFDYPSYKCYKEIKYQFVDKKLVISPHINEFEQKHASHIEEKLNGLSDVYTELKKYLSNGAVFASFHNAYDGKGTCKYISYLLCNKISNNTYGECNREKFSILQEFVDIYNENTSSTICKDMLKHLDDKEFPKVKALYELYDEYNDLAIQQAYWDETKYCKDMQYLVQIYNNFLNKYESRTTQFNEVLKEFEVLMDAITKTGRTRCENEHFSIRKPRLFEPTVVQVPPLANPSLGSEGKLPQGDPSYREVKSGPPEVTIPPTTLEGEQERSYPENSKGYEVAAASLSQELVEGRQPHEDLEHSDPHESSRRQQAYVSRGPYGPGGYYGQVGYREAQQTLPPGEDSYSVSEQLEGPLPGKENTGFMTNVQSAISGFMKDVDPVPVVGVSGGMGALFLLFRVFKVLKIYPCVYSIFKEKFTFLIITL